MLKSGERWRKFEISEWLESKELIEGFLKATIELDDPLTFRAALHEAWQAAKMINLPAEDFDRLLEDIEHGEMPQKIRELLKREPKWAAKRYKAEDYTYRVFWSPEDDAWIGVCTEFQLLSHIDEESQRGAFFGIVDLIEDTLEEIYDGGEEPPAPAWTRPMSFRSEEEAMEFADVMYEQVMSDETW